MNIDREIKKIINEAVNDSIFPDVSVGLYYKENDYFKKSLVSACNVTDKRVVNVLNNYLIYDIASLTKPLATVLIVLSLIKEGKLRLTDKLSDIFNSKIIPGEKSSITIEQLLSHSAGFPAHKPYFKELVNKSMTSRKDVLFKLLIEEELVYQPGSKVIYSDLGYMLLGLIIEWVSGTSLDSYLSIKILSPLNLSDSLFFNIDNSKVSEPDLFAPVEDCPWRGRVLIGEVSDENCWIIGGVAGHAGLFGNISGVLDLTAVILDIWKGRVEHPNINRKDLNDFLKRRTTIKENTWALGFDTPTKGQSSSGKYLSPDSVGHLGFTGTSFWIDPQRELAIVLLSNRVHPSRENELIREFRPYFHDRVVEILGLQ